MLPGGAWYGSHFYQGGQFMPNGGGAGFGRCLAWASDWAARLSISLNQERRIAARPGLISDLCQGGCRKACRPSRLGSVPIADGEEPHETRQLQGCRDFVLKVLEMEVTEEITKEVQGLSSRSTSRSGQSRTSSHRPDNVAGGDRRGELAATNARVDPRRCGRGVGRSAAAASRRAW